MQPCDTIGSHLCERLLAEGNDIICIDNYFTGHKSNIRHLLSHPNFEVIRHDIVYPYMAEIEEIYNLACPASPIYYQHDPIKTTQTSVIGSINMLGMAKYNRAKILQASTSEVYGDPLIHPQREDYWGHVNPLGIRSCYDEGEGIHREGDRDVVFHFHGYDLVVHHVVVAAEHASAVIARAQLSEYDLVERRAFRDVEIRNPVAPVIVEVHCRVGALLFQRAVDAPGRASLRGVFGPEPAQGPERR